MKRVSKQTKFFRVNYNPKDKSVRRLFGPIRKAETRYHKIFRIRPIKFDIIIVYSRKEFDKYAGFKTEGWVDGYVRRPNLIVFSPSIRKKYVKTKSGRYHDYNSFFDHEINHFFYTTLVGSYNPVWLSEGYAMYMMKKGMKPLLSKKELRKIREPENFLFSRYIKKQYFRYVYEFYSVSFCLVKYLIEKFGHKKILTLIKRFSKNPYKKNLEKEFKEIYGMSIKEAVRKSI
jgi:hypothetical protein